MALYRQFYWQNAFGYSRCSTPASQCDRSDFFAVVGGTVALALGYTTVPLKLGARRIELTRLHSRCRRPEFLDKAACMHICSAVSKACRPNAGLHCVSQ